MYVRVATVCHVHSRTTVMMSLVREVHGAAVRVEALVRVVCQREALVAAVDVRGVCCPWVCRRRWCWFVVASVLRRCLSVLCRVQHPYE